MNLDRDRSQEADLARAVRNSKAPAISRAAAILRLLGKSEKPLNLQGIARELGLVPSTCLYVLRTLVAEELVSFDLDTKRYSLDAGVLTLARNWLRKDEFTVIAQPLLDDLAHRFDVTAVGVQIFGLEHITAVAVSRSGGNLRLSTQVGSRFPALISATGRCIAAYGGYSLGALEQRFSNLRWDEGPTLDVWKAQIEETRSRGYGIDEGNYIAGVTVVSVPVWSASGSPSHALIATGLSGALRQRGLQDLTEALLLVSRSISNQLSPAGT